MSKPIKISAWILVSVLVIILGLCIYRSSWREHHKNKFVFPSTIVVTNTTRIPYIDTLSAVVLNKIYKYDTINLTIVSMPPLFTEELDIVGYLQKDPRYKNIYFLFINLDLIVDQDVYNVISHEMTHVDQMQKRRLIDLPNQLGRIFDGDTIMFNKVEYNKRPFEIDAISRSISIEKHLKHLIYKKFL